MKKLLLSVVLCGALTSVLISGCSSPEEKLQALRKEKDKLELKELECKDRDCSFGIEQEIEGINKKLVELLRERNKDPQFIKHKKELENKVDELNKEYDKLEAEVEAMKAKQPNCFNFFDNKTPEERSNCSKANEKQLAPMKDKAYKAFIKRNEAEIELRKFVNE